MSSTSIFPNFRLILDAALEYYATQTGIDLTKYPSAHKLQCCGTSEAVLQLLHAREMEFKDYRERNRRLIDFLGPVVQVVHAFSGALSNLASPVPFLPIKTIFVGIDVLLTAAKGVSASYDALVDLFDCMASFLQRLHIYTGIQLDSMMAHILIRVMVEVLSVLALATKQIKQGRLTKFARRLLGERETEAILQRLDRLTQEEALMTVAQTLQVVHGLFNNLKIVMDDGKVSMGDIHRALVTIQETADKSRRNQSRKDVRSWLSPPDPSTNHIIARRDHHNGTAEWFLQSNTFKEWKAAGTLLWMHGKPGSGKSVLCSSIIQEIQGLQDMGLALMTYFYCDFRDSKKRDVRHLVASLLVQLSYKSDPSCNILSDLYSKYDDGARQPEDDELIECLEKILKLEGQPSMYIIVDAIDECPNTSSVNSCRDRVLKLVVKLAALRLPHVYMCLTSRLETDIRVSLESLASHIVSLHDQSGQKADIVAYVHSVVDSDQSMQRWRAEDKKRVVETLSRKADGMFRWIACQLGMLRRCLPAAIPRALDDLPESLDGTYERILLNICKARQIYAQRLFRCLAASTRPLRVDELAEVLAIRFDEGAYPTYHAIWRSEDPEEAVLSTCSSLISIVNVEDGSPVVQFSHFSVKEYLTSARLANGKRSLSFYHILPTEAHKILAQASLGVLLALDDQVDRRIMQNCPLAVYAAENWFKHAQFENVSSSIEEAMERLFVPTMPHFVTWIWIYDIDFPSREIATHPTRPEAVPLYYATLCGLRSLVEHIIVTHPQDVNARGGYYGTPLHAAFAKGNVEIGLLLLEHHADVNGPNEKGRTPLHVASHKARLDVVELLVKHHANVNAQDNNGNTPLIIASGLGEVEIARVLLRCGASVDSREEKGCTPVMSASQNGRLDVVRLLLKNGAAVGSRDNDGWTPLIVASRHGHLDVVSLLLQKNADVESTDDEGSTPLMAASMNGYLDVVCLLLKAHADVNTRNADGLTPLALASLNGHLRVVRLLLDHRADVGSYDNRGGTPLMSASVNGHLDVVRLLIERGAAVDPHNGWTPLILASMKGHVHVVRLLLEKGAVVGSHNHGGLTPLASASKYGHLDVVRLLLRHDAAVDPRDGQTPLMLASLNGHANVVYELLQSGAAVEPSSDDDLTAPIDADPSARVGQRRNPLDLASAEGHLSVTEPLIKGGADVDTRNRYRETPLIVASACGRLATARLLLDACANANSRDRTGSTALHRATEGGHLDVVRLLLERGADANFRDGNEKTALDLASETGRPEVARFLAGRIDGVAPSDAAPQNGYFDDAQSSLHSEDTTQPEGEERTSLHTALANGNLDSIRYILESCVDVNERDAMHRTPLDVASVKGELEVMELLVKYGADLNCQNRAGWTPLHNSSRYRNLEVARLLLDHGANVDAKNRDKQTPLHLASYLGGLEIVKLLVKRGADLHVQSDDGRTPYQQALCAGQREVVQYLSKCGGQGGVGLHCT